MSIKAVKPVSYVSTPDQEVRTIGSLFHVDHLVSLLKPVEGLDDVVGQVPYESATDLFDELIDHAEMQEKRVSGGGGGGGEEDREPESTRRPFMLSPGKNRKTRTLPLKICIWMDE